MVHLFDMLRIPMTSSVQLLSNSCRDAANLNMKGIRFFCSPYICKRSVVIEFLRLRLALYFYSFSSRSRGCLHDHALPGCNEAWDRFDVLKIAISCGHAKLFHSEYFKVI